MQKRDGTTWFVMILMASKKLNFFDAKPVRPDSLSVATPSSLVFIWRKVPLKEWLDVWPKATASELQPELWA
jgi:hypothetical protein